MKTATMIFLKALPFLIQEIKQAQEKRKEEEKNSPNPEGEETKEKRVPRFKRDSKR